ncbi:MAG: dynamin family protein [Planctomycetaceae bacterium]|nr:dynamin family protein [Planctomycetaceae bacterium]
MNTESFHSLFGVYAELLPRILGGHYLTQKLVPRVQQGLILNESPFTVAVVGQMRVGKSSLLNALVGADLAVTGVNETTATVNWFKYAAEENCDKFRVIWKNRPEEEFPRSEIHKWIGNSTLAAETQQLEFFANAPFLKNAYIVDTPGTRAVIESHEETIQDFITRLHGDKADAVIYVLMPIARQTDSELLKLFEQNSRIPGAAPYNSLAVIHKWETIEANDPHREVLSKVEIIRQNLKDQIADAIPVSAPLGWAAEHFCLEPFWNTSFELGCQPESIISKLLLTDKYFESEIKDCSVSVERRNLIRQNYRLPWASLKFIINRVALDKIKSPEQLQETILNISGIKQLREILNKRFFSRSKMIRQFSVLSKTLPACNEAAVALRNHKITYNKLQEDAEEAAAESTKQNLPQSITNYIQETKNIVQNDLKNANNTLNELDQLVQPIKDIFNTMNNDTKFIDQLDNLDQYSWSKEWKIKLAYLFGQSGTELNERISLLVTDWDSLDKENRIISIENALTEINKYRREVNKESQKILTHAHERLEQIINQLEE